MTVARRPFPSRGGRRRPVAEPAADPTGRPADCGHDPDADPEQVARAICLAQLEARPRTRAELAMALSDRGVPDDVATAVLSRFTEVGLIDDAAFAQLWVSSRHRSRGLAGRALSQELRRKGVEDDVVRAAVDGLDHEQEAATARALVQRRLRSTRGLAPEVRVRRLAGLLARKGYPPGVAYRVVNDALAEEGAEPELTPDTDDLAWLED